MFELSRRQKERLGLLLELAARSPRSATVAEIAAARGVGEATARQLVAQLAGEGLVRTRRGPGGGLALAVPPARLTVRRALNLPPHPRNPSESAQAWLEARIRASVEEVLESVTLEDLSLRERVLWEPEYVI